MQLGLFVVVVFLSSMDLTGSSKVVKGKRQRRSMYETLSFSTSSRGAVRFGHTVNAFYQHRGALGELGATLNHTPIQRCAFHCPTLDPTQAKGWPSATPGAWGFKHPSSLEDARLVPAWGSTQGNRAASAQEQRHGFALVYVSSLLELFYIKTGLN